MLDTFDITWMLLSEVLLLLKASISTSSLRPAAV